MQPGNPLLLTNGQRVFGRYRLKMLVGKGASGIVWRARDEELETDIALKFLAEDFLYDASALADLKRETRRGMALAHPGIVRIFGFFQDGNQAAIAMEYVEGNTVAGLQSSRRDKIFEVAEISEWTRQLCAALHYAHTEAELVHRDLKPGNLLIDDRGRIKVADFGIAAGINDAHTRVIGSAEARGTLAYMSPQQLLGQHACVGHDVYSVGATLYELLTGRPPFFSGDISLQVRTVVPPSIAVRRTELRVSGAAIPDLWEQTIAACLEKDASRRPTSAAEIAQLLGIGDSGSFPVRASGPLPQLPITEDSSSGATASLHSARTERPSPPASSSAPTVVLPSSTPATTSTADGANEKRRAFWWAAGGVIVTSIVFIAAAIGLYFGSRTAKTSATEASQASATIPATNVAPKIESTPPPAPAPVSTTPVPAEIEKEKPAVVEHARPAVVIASQLRAARQSARELQPRREPTPATEPSESAQPLVRPETGPARPESQQRPLGRLLRGAPPPGPNGEPPPPQRGAEPGNEPRGRPAEAEAGPQRAAVRTQNELIQTASVARLPTLDRPELEHPFVLPETEIAMMWVPPGHDGMGSPPEVRDGPEDEQVRTDVSFPEGFWLGKFEVSRREYRTVVGAISAPVGGATDESPVTNINWAEAMIFCEKLTARERAAGRLPDGYVYTLPTEAQWEYALKSGTLGMSAPYSSLEGAAWGSFSGTTQPQPRGQLAASPWGFHDMYGNVAEWCYDWYENHHPGGRYSRYSGPRSGSRRVVKGGSFRDDEREMHPSARSSAPPLQRSVTVGFRVALAPKP